jgi:hypothetical protein
MSEKLSLIILVSLSTLIFISCGTESTQTYTLTTSVNGEGTISPSSGEFEEGESVTLTGTPSQHWVFNNWSGDGSGSSNIITITMDSDKNVVGNFSERLYPLNITVEGEGTVDEEVIQSKSEFTNGTVVQLTPNPSNGWKFVEWSGDVESTEEVIELTVDGEVNLIITFERKDYPLAITIEGEGTVEQEVVQSKTTDYPYETVVQLTPSPSNGWKFIEWGGDLTGNENPKQITIDGEKNVTVTFEPIAFLGDNGVTIMCPNGEVGEIGIVNGVEYEVVDRELLIQRWEEGQGQFDTKVCVSLITNMRELFYEKNFNGDINDWDVSSVTDMGSMFRGSPFNQPINNWDLSMVTDTNRMFASSSFNQPLDQWDVSNVIDMTAMFGGTSFNHSINDWDMSSVTDISFMFAGSSFNQPLNQWDVSNVSDMSRVFWDSDFDQPINNWNVSSVTEMDLMFSGSPFNQPLNQWDVSNVTEMGAMFSDSDFNQDISNWCVWRIESEPSSFSEGSPLTEENKPEWGTCPD